jgi:hypothetical protein
MDENRADETARGTGTRTGQARAGWDVVEVSASLTAFGALPTRARAVVVVQGTGRRAARALAGLGACWALALVSVFIPVAHFVLVPSFTVAGIVVAGLRLREDRRLVGVSGTCPRCGTEQEFEAGGRFEDDRTLDCPRCHQLLRLIAGPPSEHPPGSPRADRARA